MKKKKDKHESAPHRGVLHHVHNTDYYSKAVFLLQHFQYRITRCRIYTGLCLLLSVCPECYLNKSRCVFNSIFAQISFRSYVHVLLKVAVEELIIIEMINSVLKDT